MKAVPLRKKVLFPVLIVFVLALAGVICYLLRPTPAAGEVYSRDLRGGYDMYVTEAYLYEMDIFEGYTVIGEHNVYKVTDESVKEQILTLCTQLECVREYNKASDIPLGSGREEYIGPSIYIVGGDIGYMIKVISREKSIALNILNEVDNDYVFEVSRIDLTACPADTDPYDYISDYFDPDTFNSEFGIGWYSVMTDDESIELAELISSISGETAQVVKTISLDTRNS